MSRHEIALMVDVSVSLRAAPVAPMDVVAMRFSPEHYSCLKRFITSRLIASAYRGRNGLPRNRMGPAMRHLRKICKEIREILDGSDKRPANRIGMVRRWRTSSRFGSK